MQVKLKYEILINFDYEANLPSVVFRNRKWTPHIFRGFIYIDSSVIEIPHIMRDVIKEKICDSLKPGIDDIVNEFPLLDYEIVSTKVKLAEVVDFKYDGIKINMRDVLGSKDYKVWSNTKNEHYY